MVLRWPERSIFSLLLAYGGGPGPAEKRVHKCKREADVQLVYHKRWLPSLAVHFKSSVRSSLDDAVRATREAIVDEHLDPSTVLLVSLSYRF